MPVRNHEREKRMADAVIAPVDTDLEEKNPYAKLDKQQLIAELERRDIIAGLSEDASGYLITTPNPLYNGSTSGVIFRNGSAFIADAIDDEGTTRIEAVIRDLVGDFGYTMERITMGEYRVRTASVGI